ncbi:MAG TPA: DUF444 family protein [Geobacteraceae bacterium]|nr:DUF444 family protein [Geobacteraceae bacterium]
MLDYFNAVKAQGLSPEREERLLAELRDERGHEVVAGDGLAVEPHPFYGTGDLAALQDAGQPVISYTAGIRSLDELLERDRLREKDGFPRKIRIGRLIRPGRGGKERFVIVPTTVEEKFIHDRVKVPQEEESTSGGSGEGNEGEVIGEQPVRPEGEEGGEGAGAGGGESHELESTAYDLGKILTEKFELPNLKDKGKKSALVRYSYDLTDRHRGFGQLLDKKATLRKILETNIALGNVPDLGDIDTSRFLIAPSDKVYRILSRELDYESQALVFFVRDYSGSMDGRPTELVASQHVLIYSWLLYQYAMQVETRFILHDNEAKEAPDFYTYYNSKVAGGTKVAAAYRLVNEIVEKENLARDYNIYVFHGTDGDDWDTEGKEALPELRTMLGYANRVGVTVVRHAYLAMTKSEVENYLEGSRLLTEKPGLLRMDVMGVDAEEGRVIEGIKRLIS